MQVFGSALQHLALTAGLVVSLGLTCVLSAPAALGAQDAQASESTPIEAEVIAVGDVIAAFEQGQPTLEACRQTESLEKFINRLEVSPENLDTFRKLKSFVADCHALISQEQQRTQKQSQ